MVTVLNFKDLIDLPKWRTLATSVFANQSLICDLRNNEDRDPYIYGIPSSFLVRYNVNNDGWTNLPVLGAVLEDGIMMSAQGPRGTIAAGATITTFTLTTALPVAVGINQLANRGDGRGFKIRIIGNAAGSSGKTEERIIVGNTAGATPTIVVDSAFSFIPLNGDAYEFLSGKIFMSNHYVNSWTAYDILTNSPLVLAVTPITFIQPSFIGLDELLVPYDRTPGEGFFGILTATASSPVSLTGQAISGDAIIVTNQYRNFQIRVIEDIAIPTAVGQRRNIISHTAGPNPIYTVPVWTTQPNPNAKYVIENNGDLIIAWSSGSLNTFTYSVSGNIWDTNVTFAIRTSMPGSGFFSAQAFSIEPDIASPPNSRQSHIYSFRGGNSSTLDLFDIANAATGTWSDNIDYAGNWTVISDQAIHNGTCTISDPITMEGKYIYMNLGSTSITSLMTQYFFRFDMKNRVFEPYTMIRVPTSSTTVTGYLGKTLAITHYQDGNTKLSFLIFQFNGQSLSGVNIPTYSLPITR
jgi:hypothetical protein